MGRAPGGPQTLSEITSSGVACRREDASAVPARTATLRQSCSPVLVVQAIDLSSSWTISYSVVDSEWDSKAAATAGGSPLDGRGLGCVGELWMWAAAIRTSRTPRAAPVRPDLSKGSSTSCVYLPQTRISSHPRWLCSVRFDTCLSGCKRVLRAVRGCRGCRRRSAGSSRLGR